MQLYPTTEDKKYFGNGYLLLMDFNEDHSVKVGMRNVFSNNQYMEDTSSWEVITDNGPVLSFNTFNKCLHTFSDPEDLAITPGQYSNDETGTGVGGDYEFIVVDAPEDGSHLMLKGKKRATYNLLTPLEDGVVFKDYIEDVQNFQQDMFPLSAANDNYLVLGDSVMVVDSLSTGIPSIYPKGADQVAYQIFNPFLVTKRSGEYYIRFRDAFTLKDGTKAQDFRYDAAQDKFLETSNPNAMIIPTVPADFFSETLLGGEKGWRLNRSSDKSESASAAYNKMYTEMSSFNPKTTLNYILLKAVDGQVCLNVYYRQKNSNSVAKYYFNVERTAEGCRLVYDKPAAEEHANFLASFPALNEFIGQLSQNFYIQSTKTDFLLNTVKLVSVADADYCFAVSIL